MVVAVEQGPALLCVEADVSRQSARGKCLASPWGLELLLRACHSSSPTESGSPVRGALQWRASLAGLPLYWSKPSSIGSIFIYGRLCEYTVLTVHPVSKNQLAASVRGFRTMSRVMGKTIQNPKSLECGKRAGQRRCLFMALAHTMTYLTRFTCQMPRANLMSRASVLGTAFR